MTVCRLVSSALAFVALITIAVGGAQAQEVTIKTLGRFEGWRENALIGYGLVVGLAGSGDSPRSHVTKQALSNVYSRLGASVTEDEISSRNVAVVLVVANLPASANVGDKISVTVSSAGDARSLAGGTLLMTPLLGPDRRPYALAQGPLVTGGHSFEAGEEFNQRNYPTTARLDGGATIELEVNASLLDEDGAVGFFLFQPNFTTATRIADALNAKFTVPIARVENADEVRVEYSRVQGIMELAHFLSMIENTSVKPDRTPMIVVNERTGTIVAGGDVTISSVVISQGDIQVTVRTDNEASQPQFIRGFANDISSLIVTNRELEVVEGENDVVASFPNSTVGDLVQGLSQANVDTRRIIGVLQAMKAAGALHAKLVIQ